jgi:hypothetical protein
MENFSLNVFRQAAAYLALVGYAADWGYRRERRAALQAQEKNDG